MANIIVNSQQNNTMVEDYTVEAHRRGKHTVSFVLGDLDFRVNLMRFQI